MSNFHSNKSISCNRDEGIPTSLMFERQRNGKHNNMWNCDICSPEMKMIYEFHLEHSMNGAANSIQTNRRKCLSFVCYMCDAEFKSISETRSHMKFHSRDKQCKICNEFLTVSELNAHLCGKDKCIVCEYCGETFTATINILNHLNNSHDKRRFRCSKCKLWFPMVILRDYHIKSHEEELPKPFSCINCGKCFAERHQLAVHQRIHEEKSRNFN